ncbi:hypothetical protein MLD38_030246 [Melastoma candidum]|uniref:Uncharacterized protein n=1 Tax=Melastoma candidum TaxID=119954 RepID=A0ACB9MKW1_9MYRT|nr:hypothetical protein MLD38_030246 [Melastoma candidum]
MSSACEGGTTPSSSLPPISTSMGQQYFAFPHSVSDINPSTSQSQAQIDQPPPKKKRNLPGNPDPDAEVVALSPKSLMATNRFVCEICNKGFQRDQNLQLHRRGHNLPWKLKQRENKEVTRKKVYVCPEPGCVHHDRSRALGDLTGIKKHFSRKHGEKKWKCDKCSKLYAVRSDWKAHSKVCGTKEYRCDCGTLFSRRDSFITHRAFCDALAEESTRSISTADPVLVASQNSIIPTTQFHPQSQNPLHQQHSQFMGLKQEDQQLGTTTCVTTTTTTTTGTPSTSITTCFSHQQDHQLPPWLSSPPSAFPPGLDQGFGRNYSNPIPNPSVFSPTQFLPLAMSPSPSMSATALLQKAAQMGATMSSCASIQDMLMHPSYSNDGFGAEFSSTKEETGTRVAPKASGPDGSSSSGGGNSGEGSLTRDFLGLRPVSRNDIFRMAGMQGLLASDQIDPHHRQQQDQNQQIHKPWQGD